MTANINKAIPTLEVREPFLRTDNELGEGPLYDTSTNILHYVDIDLKRVYHADIRSLSVTYDQYDEVITCLALRKNHPGKLACTTATGFALLDGPNIKYLAKPLNAKTAPNSQFNDGGCDPKGRYIAGTRRIDESNETNGSMWVYDPSTKECKQITAAGEFGDGNGVGFSPDLKTFYFTDTGPNLIYGYDYAEDGTLSNRRNVVDALAQRLPSNTWCDGMCVDTDGGIWSARWAGSSVTRFKADGKVDLQVYLPTALTASSCCFGGPALDQLFITTTKATVEGGDPHLQTVFPDSGNLFVVDFSGRFKGVPRFPFAG